AFGGGVGAGPSERSKGPRSGGRKWKYAAGPRCWASNARATAVFPTPSGPTRTTKPPDVFETGAITATSTQVHPRAATAHRPRRLGRRYHGIVDRSAKAPTRA